MEYCHKTHKHLSFIIHFAKKGKYWPHEETLLQLFEIHEHIRANSNFAKNPFGKTQSGSKPVLGVGTRAGAGLGVCLSVRLLRLYVFFLPFSTGMFQLISLAINLLFFK